MANAVEFVLSLKNKVTGPARAAKAGIWAAGESLRPAEWRTKLWDDAKRKAPDGCPIKGVVMGSAKVYLLPWSAEYERGRIQTNRALAITSRQRRTTVTVVPADGDMLAVGQPTAGARCYVAVRGGFAEAPVMGSCATDTLAHVGPAPVAVGDWLAVQPAPATSVVAAPELPPEGPFFKTRPDSVTCVVVPTAGKSSTTGCATAQADKAATGDQHVAAQDFGHELTLARRAGIGKAVGACRGRA